MRPTPAAAPPASTTIAEHLRTGAVTVVVNRKSSGTLRALAALRAAVDAHHLDVREFHVASNRAELHRHISRAAKHGTDAVIVGGGDGSMAHAVDALAHRDTILGVVPLGTGNSFAQSLGIPLHDVAAAIEIIARGNVRRIDVGRVNGTHFANFATIGLSSAIAGATSTEDKHRFGPLAYALAALRPLFSHRSFRAKIKWKGGHLNVRTQDVIIANGRYFGSTPVTPTASLEDRRLKLFTASDPSRLGALVTYVAIGLHAQNHLPDAHVLAARRFTIRAQPPPNDQHRRLALRKDAGTFSRRAECAERLRTVIACLLTAAFICAVVAVVFGVYASSRPPTALDRSAAALRGHGVRAALFFTRLGRWRALVLISVVTLGVAFTLHSAVEALIILFAVQTLGQATSAVLKLLYRRRRPDAFIRRVETDRSYPSGHATTAVVFFLGLAIIVGQSPLPRWLALLLTVALGVCVIGIPWSRLALGAHYATDVVGGLFLGAAWLCVAVAIVVRFAPTSVR